jgi:hypothetical protein
MGNAKNGSRGFDAPGRRGFGAAKRLVRSLNNSEVSWRVKTNNEAVNQLTMSRRSGRGCPTRADWPAICAWQCGGTGGGHRMGMDTSQGDCIDGPQRPRRIRNQVHGRTQLSEAASNLRNSVSQVAQGYHVRDEVRVNEGLRQWALKPERAWVINQC